MSSSMARNLLCPLAQQDLAPLLFQTHKHTLLEKDGWKKSMMLDRSHEHQSQGRRLTPQKSMTGYQKAQGTLSTKIAKPCSRTLPQTRQEPTLLCRYPRTPGTTKNHEQKKRGDDVALAVLRSREEITRRQRRSGRKGNAGDANEGQAFCALRKLALTPCRCLA